MHISTGTVEPAFVPITITLESPEEARALKVLCTSTAQNAVKAKPGLSVSGAAIDNLGASIFRALKREGVSYLAKNV